MRSHNSLLPIVLILTAALLANILAPTPGYANPKPVKDPTPTIVGVTMLIILIPAAFIMGEMYLTNLKKPKLQFVSENIVFTLQSDSIVNVDAVYSFMNHDTKKDSFTLYYPFPDERYLRKPELIDIKKKNGGMENDLVCDINEDEWSFTTDYPLDAPVDIKIDYSQKTASQKFEYVLTSTNSWRQPLLSADFIIRIPEQYELSKCNYRCVEMDKVDGYRPYRISKAYFYPKKNLKFAWRKAQDLAEK